MTAPTLRRLRRYDVLLLASLLWLLAKVLRYAFPPLFDRIGVEYGVSPAILGVAFTAFMLVYAAVQFPAGVLGDRLGPARVVASGAIVAAVGAVAVVVLDRLAAPLPVDPFHALVAAMVVMGAGTGVHKTVAIPLLSRVYPSRSGRALGVHDTIGTLGGVAAPAGVALALRAGGAGWRTVFLVTGGLAALVAILFAIRTAGRVPAAGRTAAADPSLRTYAAPFREPRLAAFAVLLLGIGFAYNGLVAFLPLYLVRTAGVSAAVASGLYALLFGLSVVQLASGDLSDRVGRLPVAAGTIGLATGAMAVLVVAPAIGPTASGVPLGTAAVVAALGAGAHGFRPVRAAHLQDRLPAAVAAGGFGAVRTGLMGAGAVAPAVVGFVAEVAGFRIAFGVLFATLAASLAVTLVLWVTE